MKEKTTVVTILKNLGVQLPDDYMDVDLYESGRMDSLQLMQLIMALEEKFGITIDIAEISPDIFKSVRTITDYIHNKCSN